MKKRTKILIFVMLLSLILAISVLAAFANGDVSAESLLSDISTTPPSLSADGKSIILPTLSSSDFRVEIYGTSNSAVIDKGGNVYTPLVDTEVGIMYKVVSNNDPSDFAVDEYKEARIMIKGQYETTSGENKEPSVFPKLREWKGGTGTVAFTESSRIVVSHPDFLIAATKAAEYIRAITGFNTEIVEASQAANGDLVFAYTNSAELGGEGYTIKLSDVITVSAYSETGALYGGTTVAQMLDIYDGFMLPRGYVRDYPQYSVRSIMLDVARYYIPMDTLREFTKYMAYFKLNTIHVHINDSYGQQKYAFRIESKKYPEINANLKGNVYTQEEYRDYQKEMLGYGIKVITEIDSPGHAGFVAEYDPTLIVPSNETYINLSTDIHSTVNGVSYTYYDKSVEFMKGLFDEFLGGENPVIIEEADVFHIGMDEYTWNHQQFKLYMKEMTDYVKSYGKKVQVWSSLQTSDFSAELPIDNDVTVNYWGFADFENHIKAGFPCVANNPMKLYVVPGGTNSFVDRLSLESLYASYKVNVIQNEKLELAESSPLLLGAEAAFWNDVNVGVSIIDIFSRLRDQMLIVSEKSWYGNNKDGASFEEFIGRVDAFKDSVPLVNPSRFVKGDDNGNVLEYDFESVENGAVKDKLGNYDAILNGLEVENFGSGNMLKLNGEGYLSLPFATLGNPFTASFELIYEGSENGVLFASPDGKLIINYNGTGKIAYSRDMMTYTFSHVFKEGIQYNVKIVSDLNDCYLYVNGVFDSKGKIDTMLTEDKADFRIKFTSFALPVEKIGAGVVGYIDNLKLSNNAESHDKLSGLSYVNYGNVALGKDVTASGVEVTTKWGPECAVDGILSSDDMDNKTSLNNAHDAWLVIDLGKVYEIDKVVIDFAQRPNKYAILLSVDGDTYESVYTETEKPGNARGTDTIELNGKKARFVKYQTLEMFLASNNYYYSGNFHEIMVYSTDIDTEIIDKATNLLATLNGAEKEFLSESIELVRYVVENNEFADAGIALRCLDDLCDELSAGGKLISNADRTLITELVKNKKPRASYSQDSYSSYEYEYKFAIGTALDLTASDGAIREYAARIENASLELICAATIDTNMSFDKPESILDNNEASFAATSKNQAAGDYLTLKYEAPINVKSLKISMANNSKFLANAALEISYDGENFITVKTYSLTSFKETDIVLGGEITPTKNEIFFRTPLMNVVAIRIRVTSEAARSLQINEIYVNHVTDFEALAQGITYLNSEDYTEESFKYMLPFASGMATTRYYMNNASTYMRYLVKRADLSLVKAEIERLSAIDSEKFTPHSYERLAAAISNAEAFISSANANTTIYEEQEAVEALKLVESSLIEKREGVDTTELEKLIFKSLNGEDYGYYSFKAFSDAKDEALTMLGSDFTQASVDAELTRLERLYSNLTARGSRENVALGKDVTVSALEAGNAATRAEFATDGIVSGEEFRLSLESVDNAWLIIDLGKEYVIDGIDIIWCRKSAGYKMLVSSDGENWSEVFKDANGKNVGSALTNSVKIDTPISARYVKFEQTLCFFGNVEKNYRYCGSIYEIKVYAADTSLYMKELLEAYDNAKSHSSLHPDCKLKNDAAIAEAERIFASENPTQDEINNAVALLTPHSELVWTKTQKTHSFNCSCGLAINEEHDLVPTDESHDSYTVYTCTVCGMEITQAQVKLISTQMVLDEGMNMNYIFAVGEGFDELSVSFELLGKIYEGRFIEINADGDYVYRFDGILPQYMTDTITATVTLKTGNTEFVSSYGGVSIKSYLGKIIETYPDDKELIRLASDILVYGSEAQLYANYKTDTLATDGMNIDATDKYTRPQNVRKVENGSKDVSFNSVGLNLKDKVSMYFTFSAKKIEGLTLKISINGREKIYGAFDFDYVGNGIYKVYFDGIRADEFADTVKAEFFKDGKVTGAIAEYSVNSYISESHLGSSNPAGALVKALANYGKSVLEYKEATK